MYGQLYNPCLFQQLPVFHENLLRQKTPHYPTRQGVKMTTSKIANGLTLTFSKPLSTSTYHSAIESEYYKIKQNQQPTYKVVTDFFGNQYYVANQLTEQEIIDQIDINAIGRKLAKESFQDYSLELSHDGSSLLVSSQRDNIDESLQFDTTIADFHVAGCGVINDDTAILKINVIFDTMESLEAKYQQQEEQEEKRRLLAIKQAQRIAECKQAKLRETEESKRAALEKERLRIVAENKRRAAAHLQAKQEHEMKLAREREAKLKQQQQQAKEEQERQRQAQEEQERERQEQMKREKLLQEQIEYQRSLVEEEQRMRAKKAQEAKAKSNNIVNISIDFKDGQHDGYESSSVESDSASDNDSDISHPLRRYSSPPVLEDVEDEEMGRYNDSLDKSPRGTSIIEDA